MKKKEKVVLKALTVQSFLTSTQTNKILGGAKIGYPTYPGC